MKFHWSGVISKFFKKKLGFTPSKGQSLLRDMELLEKEKIRMKRIYGSCLKRAPNSRLKALYIIDKRKAFCRQRIAESSCRR